MTTHVRRSRTKNRAGWYAKFEVKAKRVIGKLYDDGREVRDFNVGLQPNMSFKVDIGTGSGVKVEFDAR